MPHFKEQRAEVGRGAWVPLPPWHMAQAQKSSLESQVALGEPVGGCRPLLKGQAGETWNVFEGKGKCHLGSPPPAPVSPRSLACWDNGSDKWILLFPSSTPPLLPSWGVLNSENCRESSKFPTELVCALIWFKPEQGEGPGIEDGKERVLEGPQGCRLAQEMATPTA